MTLFATLLVLIAGRLSKLGEHWQLDHRVEIFFHRIRHFSMVRTVGMTLIAVGMTFLLLHALHGLLFSVPLLVARILIGLLCIGAGKTHLHYHAYLNTAAHDNAHTHDVMASELTLIHGVPPNCNEREFLRELQNALLWNNFRFYLAPSFWLIVGGPWGPVTLVGYAFLRAWQSWLTHYQAPRQRLQPGIDAILHVLDWIPVRLAGVVYTPLEHGGKAPPAWFTSLTDLYTPQYQVLTRLVQFSPVRGPHTDKVETSRTAVSLAKKASFAAVVVIAVLTIYEALVQRCTGWR